MARGIRRTVRRTVTVRTRVQIRRTLRTHSAAGHSGHGLVVATARALPAAVPDLAADGYRPIDDPDREYDLFLSHASEDKDFARPLVEALTRRGIHVWFDETAITIGDSLRESVDRGLTRSRFGAVLFSHSFFAKRWTNYELNGLVTREVQGRKVILPVWHPELTAEELVSYSPSLADKKALVASTLSVDQIADQLTSLVLRRNRGGS